jgi:DNA-binding CsgD family transcriptional regulator
MTRDEKLAKARQLREGGTTYPAIAAELGVAKKTVRRWLNPHEAEADRAVARRMKKRYRGKCESCGSPTNGCEGPGKASRLCGPCSRRRRHEQRRWTPETIRDAMRRWAEEHGRQPHAGDWVGASEHHPPSSTVIRECGSWDQAIRDAGFESHKRQVGLDPAEIVRLYVDEQIGTYTIARQLGVSERSVVWHLEKAGVPRRSQSEAQRLRFARAS